ncbi:MAG TPA: UPF0182 family protein [Acidimicrobiales bacterium]|nr:UPF0182 family protein [Acidimicrobiales bacterium]
MRTPQDLPPSRARGVRPRGRWWIAVAVAVLIALFASLKSLATLYTDSLWFSSVKQHAVWSTLVAVKVGLFASFGAAFFAVLWVNLLVCDRLAGPVTLTSEPEDELVRRYRTAIRPYSGRIYAGIALVVALIAASGTIGEWQNWILFRHGGNFGVTDPQFHRDIGFFVFKLPFLSFVVNWSLASLVVIFVITAIFHYLNGGIRPQRVSPRVRPVVKAHLSVLLALIALAKAAGYLLARYQLDLSHNGYVEGAGYTDVNARLPALSLLFWISLGAAAVLLYNIRRRGWTLPVLAVGVWAFVALVVGVIYPAVLQVLKVNPAQSTLERPFIERNIKATRAAFALNGVKTQSFAGNEKISADAVATNLPTLNNVRLWDPDPNISLQTFQKLQYIRAYYAFESVAVDRYTVNGQLEPAIVGVRQLNSSAVPSSWVNQHLQYTHGEGLVLAQANQATSGGNPTFGIQDVPAHSSPGLPRITQGAVYFGLQSPGYVVANTRQPELDYQLGSGNNVETHYAGTGGVQVGSFLTKAAFAIRLGDFNLLISDQVTSKSRIIFVRDVQQMAQKAAPFLHFDNDPYAAVINGHIDWILDAYTTTDQYPYSQNADTAQLPPGSGLPNSYNYVRNSVKVVINAYSGQMTFYDMTTPSTRDPILQAYEGAFPHMFTPAAEMSATLKAHLRYPEDLFSAQAAMYGRYHITQPAQFFTAGNNGGDAWSLSPTSGAGSPSNALAVTTVTNAQGQVTGTPPQRMSPLYQVLAQPGDTKQSFTISDAYVPASQGNQVQNLSAFIMSAGDGQPGQLTVYVTPPGASVVGPALADSRMQSSQAVSKQISFLDQHGSNVLLGNTLMIPIDQSMLYIRPMYVESSGNPQPQVQDVIAVFGNNVSIEPTLDGVLTDVLGTSVGTGAAPTSPTQPGGTSGPLSTTVQDQIKADVAQAIAYYQAAEAALKSGQPGSLGTYETNIDAMNQQLQAVQALLATAAPTTTTGTTTTTTTTTTTARPSAAGSAAAKARSTTTTAPPSAKA